MAAIATLERDERYDSTLAQACCERTSLLGERTRDTEGCKFVNITARADSTSSQGIQIAIDSLTGPEYAIWFAPPCTGENSWQQFNIVRRLGLLPKLTEDRDLCLRLFKAFRLV